MPDLPNPFLPDDWDLDTRSLELVHRQTGARVSVTDGHIDALLGLTPGTTEALRAQYNGVVGSTKAVGERVSELLRRTELPGVVDIGASLAEELVRRGPVERAAELMNVRGVGWTRLERILRAFYANVGAAPAAVADDAPLVALAEVEALWAGPMGRAGGRAGWSLAQEALVMVHGAGLGALSLQRLGQLAAALRALVDAGTLEHEALLGAVGPLLRRWMEQGEPEESGESGEPSGAPPAPEEPGEDPFPEGRPLPPEEFLHGRRYDILVISYDVFTRTFRLVLLLADAVWDRPGVVPDAGVTPTDAEMNRLAEHAQKRRVPPEAKASCRDFATPPLPDSEAIFAQIMERYQLDTLFVLALMAELSNPTQVVHRVGFFQYPGQSGLRRFAWEGVRSERRVEPGALLMSELRVDLDAERAPERPSPVALDDATLDARTPRETHLAGLFGAGSSTPAVIQGGQASVATKHGDLVVSGPWPRAPEGSVNKDLAWSFGMDTTLLFARRQRVAGAGAWAKYKHSTRPTAHPGTWSMTASGDPRSSATVSGGYDVHKTQDEQLGADPSFLFAPISEELPTTKLSELEAPPPASSTSAGPQAGVKSWQANVGPVTVGEAEGGDVIFGLDLGVVGFELTATPGGSPNNKLDLKISLDDSSSTWEEHEYGAHEDNRAAAAENDHKLQILSRSLGAASVTLGGDARDAAQSSVSARGGATADHVTKMRIQPAGRHGYTLTLHDPPEPPAVTAWGPEIVISHVPGPFGTRKTTRTDTKLAVEAGVLEVLRHGGGRRWRLVQQVAHERILVEDDQLAGQVKLATKPVISNGAVSAHTSTVTAELGDVRGDWSTLGEYRRTAIGLFLLK